ncbi:MAG: T9SS type A sorting domain-containing protein [Fibrobacter sp.]|nr:T9SS type A sorting domain-containing protein [Fibrobacter sp.]
MNRLILIPVLVTLIFSHAGFAEFYTKAEDYPSIQTRYDFEHGKYIYDTVFTTQILGDIRVKSSAVTVKPKGSYLEIIEEAVVAVLSSNYEVALFIEGTFTLPGKSAIVSLNFSVDTNFYSARILPAYKSDNEVDTTLGDPIVVLKKINRSSGTVFDEYSLRINNTLPDKDYRLIIRYLIPNTGSSNPVYSLKPVFLSNSSNPSGIVFDFITGSKERSYKLSYGNLNYQLSDGMTLQIPFQQSFQISATNNVSSMVHTTSFTSGDWKGKYLLLNTIIPDSVMSLLSKPIETIVLWRWNRPSSFVRKYDYWDDWSYMSNYGYQAVSQAEAIRTFSEEIVRSGNRTGLVHSIQYRSPEVFPLCRSGSTAYAKLDSYLDQFTEEYFLNSGYFEYDAAPVNPDDTIPAKDSSRYEFLESMNIVNGLYSDGEGILRHLIILSAGPASISRDLISLEEMDSLFSDISVSCDDAVWSDVSFSVVKNIALKRSMISVANFQVPEFRPSSIILQVSDSAKTYSFPLSPDQNSFSVMAKGETGWKKELVWNGYDASGALFGTAKSTSATYSASKDTGLVKLWAGNNERLASVNETGVELKYGVVSEDYCMKIFPAFKGYDSTATAYAKTGSFYAANTSISSAGKKQTKTAVIDKLQCSFGAGQLFIKLPKGDKINRIRIYSLSGKLIADFDPSQFRTSNGYLIRFSSINRAGKLSGMVIVRINGNNGEWRERIIIR